MQAARRYVEAPPLAPLPFGLLSAALVLDDNDSHLGMGVEYESLHCGTAHRAVDQCIRDEAEATEFTTDDGKLLFTGDAFHVYALHTCRLLGGYTGAQADAQAKLEAGEGRAIEEGAAEQFLAAADDITPTAGTAVHPLAGLALLEAYAAANYGGTPVIHMPRDIGTLLSNGGVLNRYGRRLETVQGAVVASGGGYSVNPLTVGAEASDDGSRWLWATGAVTVRRGPVEFHGGAIQGAEGIGINQSNTLALRPVVVTHECFAVAVLVQSPTVVLA